jgi:DNA-binding transcriptional regulator YhcF (GntR family)
LGWNFDRDRPIYLQLEDRIKGRIVLGEYPPGSKLPAVRELAEEAQVNPNTLQRALADLEREGLLFAQRTSGRFVTEDEAKIHAAKEGLAKAEIARFLASLRALGIGVKEATELILRQEEG